MDQKVGLSFRPRRTTSPYGFLDSCDNDEVSAPAPLDYCRRIPRVGFAIPAITGLITGTARGFRAKNEHHVIVVKSDLASTSALARLSDPIIVLPFRMGWRRQGTENELRRAPGTRPLRWEFRLSEGELAAPRRPVFRPREV